MRVTYQLDGVEEDHNLGETSTSDVSNQSDGTYVPLSDEAIPKLSTLAKESILEIPNASDSHPLGTT